MATASANDCTLILANDPDADRLAVATWVPSSDSSASSSSSRSTSSGGGGSSGGEWRVLSGNEIGALLGAWAWDKWREGGKDGTGE